MKKKIITKMTKRISRKNSPENFAWIFVLDNEFMQRHTGIEAFLGEQSMKTFRKLLYEKFFDWLNNRKNSQKMICEIKREFMCIADAVLLFELANHQRRITPYSFVVGPFQTYLEECAQEDEPKNIGVIPYSLSLHLPPISKLEDTQLHIWKNEIMELGLDSVGDMDDYIYDDHIYDEDENKPNVSAFFCDSP